jgi:hypothetical protein
VSNASGPPRCLRHRGSPNPSQEITHGPGYRFPYHIPLPADAVLKGAETECKALKDAIKRRSLLEAAGESFAIRVSEQISGRLDVAAVKQHLGDGWRRFEVATVSTVVRVKALKPFAAAA